MTFDLRESGNKILKAMGHDVLKMTDGQKCQARLDILHKLVSKNKVQVGQFAQKHGLEIRDVLQWLDNYQSPVGMHQDEQALRFRISNNS